MRFASLFALVALFALTGCSSPHAPGPRYETPVTTGGRMCVTQCQDARDFCRQQCDLKRRSCTIAMQDQAIKDYEDYAKIQVRTRAPIEFRPSDFERPESCPRDPCLALCEGPFKSCFQECGGTITTDKNCSLFCL